MKPGKINMDRKKISSEEIASKRNFEDLLKAHKKRRPFYLSFWFIGLAGLSLLSIIAISTYRTEQRVKLTLKPEAGQLQLTKFVDLPMKNVQIPFEEFSVDAKAGGKITSASGSMIIIPAQAFVDPAGKMILGKVDIRYREFRDAVDFFLSGIPMGYDSAGAHYQLESAGMMEIKASQNGTAVQMAADKKIEIRMVSAHEGTHYNMYELDTVGRNWIYRGKDKIEEIDKIKMPRLINGSQHSAELTLRAFGFSIGKIIYVSSPFQNLVLDQEYAPGLYLPKGTVVDLKVGRGGEEDLDSASYSYPGVDVAFEGDNSEITKVKTEIATIEKTKPVKPVKAKNERYRFNVDVDPNEFPEMYEYKNLLFEVGPENKTFNQSLYQIEWDNVSMSYGKPGINYNLTFTKSGKSQTFSVYPVYEGKDSVAVMKVYRDKFRQYEVKLKDRKEKEKKMEEEWKRQQEEWAKEQKKRQQEWEEQQKAWKKKDEDWMKAKANLGTAEVIRVFSISNFGIYNSDCPVQYKDQATVAAIFKAGNDRFFGDIFHIEKSRNTLVKIYNYDSESPVVNYNKSGRNILFTVIDKETLALFDENDFASMSKDVKKYSFLMKKSDKKFNTPEDVRAFLLPAKENVAK
ncbi:MAG: hypothetical protein ACJ75J_07925 [Cytophagaceae bacterium]